MWDLLMLKISLCLKFKFIYRFYFDLPNLLVFIMGAHRNCLLFVSWKLMQKGKNHIIPNNIHSTFWIELLLCFNKCFFKKKSSFQVFFPPLFFQRCGPVYHAGTSTSCQRPFQSVMQEIPDAFFFCLHGMKIGLRVLWQKPPQLPPTCLLFFLLFPEGSQPLGGCLPPVPGASLWERRAEGMGPQHRRC